MKDRRDVLKEFGAGVLWTTPVVTAVSLPAHAKTTPLACEGCYTASVEPVSFYVEEGTEIGPVTLNVYLNTTCSGEPSHSTNDLIFARSEEEARQYCDVSGEVAHNSNAACSLWGCITKL